MSALNELQNYTFVSKYARWIESENRRETWKEAVDRVKNMMHTQYEDKNITEEIDWAYDLMFKKRVLGSQRALQFGGEPILKRHAKIYNCTSSYCDRLRFFQECFWLLLCGSGTGFSVQKHHVSKLPTLSHNKKDKRKGVKYKIEDSIEGWADSLGVLLSSYFNKPSESRFAEYKDQYIVFDYSNIRKKGATLSSGVGKAPGFEPLQNGLEKIRELLEACVESKQKKLRPIDAYDIIMHSSDAVLSGGVRRSASLALFSANDEEMAKAKTGNWYVDNPQRARSNNSALLLKDDTSYEQFSELMESVKEFGEPGFIWSDSTEMTFNPCVEVGMWPVDEKTGKSGWQGCNLSTINCSSVIDEEDFYERCKAAAIIGTLQAGFTDLEYLGKTTNSIFEREALLGVSLTGIMEKHELVLTEKVLKKGAKIAVDTNKEMAKKIAINQAARVTCLKPEGTSSSMLGTSSGIHPHHAKRYIRHVQASILKVIIPKLVKNHLGLLMILMRWLNSL
jgi:ribonucleoside-triphosphate reductase